MPERAGGASSAVDAARARVAGRCRTRPLGSRREIDDVRGAGPAPVGAAPRRERRAAHHRRGHHRMVRRDAGPGPRHWPVVVRGEDAGCHRSRGHRGARAAGGATHLADARDRALRPAARCPVDGRDPRRPTARAGRVAAAPDRPRGRRRGTSGRGARQRAERWRPTDPRAVHRRSRRRRDRGGRPARLPPALLWFASQRGVVCIAPNVGTEQTFALLDDWAPDPHRPDRDEALGIIALRFFRSHGPAPRSDFARWTGLTAADARAGIAAAGEALAPVGTEHGAMIAAAAALDAPRPEVPDLGRPLVLPGFDEYLLGYGDRALILDQGRLNDVVPGGNGVFRSTLVRRGRVVGIWTRTLRTRTCAIQANTWERVGAADRAGFERAFGKYGSFRGRTVEVTWDRMAS